MIKRLMDYCLAREGACLTFPFGDMPAVVKVRSKIFAELYAGKGKLQITLKCDPTLAVLLRQKYPETVVPGYHVVNRNKPYWNTILLENGAVPEKELLEMIDHSYREVLKKLKVTPT